MTDHRRSASRSVSHRTPVEASAHPPQQNTPRTQSTPQSRRLDAIHGTSNTPTTSPRRPSPLTIAVPSKTSVRPRPPSCSLPPRGYLRRYELDRIRARAKEITPWVPHATFSKKTAHPIVRELLFPLALAQRGGVPYGIYLGGALVLLAAAASIVERIILSLLHESGVIWEFPLVIAPFLSLFVAIALRLLALPIVVGLFSLPVRVLFRAGLLDLVTLCDTTPHAVRRSCSTSWFITLKLFRRLLALMVGASGIILLSRSTTPPSIVLLITVCGAFSYLMFRIPLLCAPILSVVADYGRRYAVHHVGTILQPCANKVRFAVCTFFSGWFISHRMLRSVISLLGLSPWPFALWINLCVWLWYSVSCIASIILHQAFLYEQMNCQRESSPAGQPTPPIAHDNHNPAPSPKFPSHIRTLYLK